MSNSVDERGEVARFYTRSRRFPKFIGRLHDGTRIPGGPYTVTQAVVGGAVVLIALTTRAQWGTGTILVDVPICLAIAWGAAWAAGRIPSTRRNLMNVIAGGASAALRPGEGRYKDQTFRLQPPHYVGGTAVIASRHHSTPAPSEATQPAAAPSPTPTMAATHVQSSNFTAVERLLQQARSK